MHQTAGEYRTRPNGRPFRRSIATGLQDCTGILLQPMENKKSNRIWGTRTVYNTLNPEIRTRSREVFQSQYNSVQSSYDPRILSKATHKSNQRSRITRPLKSLQSFCNPEILVQLKNIRPENIELGRRPGPFVIPLHSDFGIALAFTILLQLFSNPQIPSEHPVEG